MFLVTVTIEGLKKIVFLKQGKHVFPWTSSPLRKRNEHVNMTTEYVTCCYTMYNNKYSLILVLLFSIFRGGLHPAFWAAQLGNDWRTTTDISDSWDR
jgi:hypothetical protein